MVECTGLENQRTARYRRFESYIFRIAKVAQLVEHDLAKVRVAGSNPVFRSTQSDDHQLATEGEVV